METPLCPQCGTPLPARALAGLCPACLFEQGAFDTQATASGETAFVPPTIEDLAPLFPALEILEFIGRGGMGAVYKARQTELDRVVALKILPSAIARDPAFSERFTREARALAKLNHPGIVALYEFGRSGDLFFFLMEFVDGVTLRQLLHGERVSPREALAIVPLICDALQYAHDRGIVHRDIKPDNILLDRRGQVKIADFGLAKLVGPEPDFIPGTTDSTPFTEVGKLMGTPAYMAPEQIDRPTHVDHRADIYALGVIFYQMLTGELPDKPLAAPSTRTLIDVRLDEVVIRALQQNPTLRFQQASELKTRVEEISSSPPGKVAAKRKISWLRVAGALLILCLPLSIAIPIFSRSPRKDLLEYPFQVLGQEARVATEETLRQTLGSFPGIILSSQRYFQSTQSDEQARSWKIGVRDNDRNHASEVLNRAAAAIVDVFDRNDSDPLKEPVRMMGSISEGADLRSWHSDSDFVTRLRWSILTGIVLSSIGLLCVSLPSPEPRLPVSKTLRGISLGLFLTGAWMIFAVLRFPEYGGIPTALGAAILTGVPVMILGFSSRCGRLGKWVAACSWLGISATFLASLLPSDFSYPDFGWTRIEILPADGRAVAAPLKPQDGRKLKIAAVTSWLEQIDASEYSEAWKITSTLTRGLESESGWIEKVKASRISLGSTVARTVYRTEETIRIPGAPDGRYFIFTFHTDFASKSEAVETVTLVYQDDGNWRVLGYSIQ